MNQAPNFIFVPDPIQATEGEKVELKCKAYGKPTPEIKWYKGDIPMGEQDDLMVLVLEEGQEATSELVIAKTLTEHEHKKYRVQAVNSAGSVEHEFKFEGKDHIRD